MSMQDCGVEPSYSIYSVQFHRNITNPEWVVWWGCEEHNKPDNPNNMEGVGKVDIKGYVAPGASSTIQQTSANQADWIIPVAWVVLIGMLVTVLIIAAKRRRDNNPPTEVLSPTLALPTEAID